MKWVTKKVAFLVFFFSLITAVTLIAFWICGAPNLMHQEKCIRILDSSVVSIFFNIATYLALVILPSLFALPLASTVFEAWKRFAVWAVPAMLAITALLILGGEGNAYFSFGFGPFILMILYGLYFLVSLVIIIIAAVKARKRQM